MRRPRCLPEDSTCVTGLVLASQLSLVAPVCVPRQVPRCLVARQPLAPPPPALPPHPTPDFFAFLCLDVNKLLQTYWWRSCWGCTPRPLESALPSRYGAIKGLGVAPVLSTFRFSPPCVPSSPDAVFLHPQSHRPALACTSLEPPLPCLPWLPCTPPTSGLTCKP